MAAHVRKWRKALTRVGKISGKDSRVCKDEATMVDDIVEHIARELASMQPLEMNSIRVFKQVAFDGGRPPSDVYEQLSIRASKLAQGLPSALDVFGTYLRQKTSTEAWESALDILEKFPPQSIMEIVKTSYESLDKRDQAVFLHLACLFNGDNFHRVATLFDHGGTRIKGLKEKSLIDISPDGCITMHGLVEQAGREIVLQESKSKLWRQRILWEPEDIVSVLQNTTGIATTEGVSLHMCDMPRMVFIDGGILNAINNLKYFKAFTHLNDIESTLKFFPGTDNLPKTLRLLHWDAYPMTTLPSDYYPFSLIDLNLRYSNLVRLWDGILGLGKLKRLDVTGSKNLTEIPDLSRATSLEELIMKGCTRLRQIPESIGLLSCLRKLDLSQCDGLMNLQTYISETTVLPESSRLRQRPQIILTLPGAVKPLTSLANMSIEGIINIELRHLKGNAEHLSFKSEKQVPDELVLTPKDQSPTISSFHDFDSLSIRRFSYTEDNAPFSCISFSGFPCLTELNLINLNIQIIPEDIGQLHSLEKLDLSGNDFINLPTSTKNLSKLKHARLSNCVKLEALPALTELQSLNLSGCSSLESLLEPPHSIQEVSRYSLLELELDNCRKFQSFSHQLSHFTRLTYLNLSSNDFDAIPESITELTSLGTLCLNNCKQLKSVDDLPQSLEHLYAHGCDSLENVILSPDHSIKHLDLSHCFNLQQDEQLITQFLNINGEDTEEVISMQRSICLPGARIPRYFENQSSRRYTTIRLSPIRSLGFAACIVVSFERSFYLKFPAFSYDWSCEEDDEVIRINLRPNLYRASEIEEEETVRSHHLVIIHVAASSVNSERIEELRVESHLQIPDEFRFPPADILRACGIRMINED
ncbi:NB-ARC domain-containing disease resistance protein [Raphanus sativus]|nr:NB-ARC domain-containing disease resistance protein [Raphanus sativus]